MIYFIDLVHILKKLANLDFHEIYLNLIFMKSTANIERVVDRLPLMTYGLKLSLEA